MDIGVNQYLERAENELRLARAIKIISESLKEKENLRLKKEDTFYSAVISHCYYAIFYSAKAILLIKNIKTYAPNVHVRTVLNFKKYFVDSGFLDQGLLKIYDDAILKADELLGLFKREKRKRGQFIYKTLPQANIEPANESIENAIKFLRNIRGFIERN